jgi:hypothetical protein
MAQFAGKRGTGWLWVVAAIILILALVAYLAWANPEFAALFQP